MSSKTRRKEHIIIGVLNTTLDLFTSETEFNLLEISRQKQFKEWEPTEVRVHYDGTTEDKADVGNSYRQQGNPLLITFEDCQNSISPKSQ